LAPGFESADSAVCDDEEELFFIFCQALKILADVPASWITERLMIPFPKMFD